MIANRDEVIAKFRENLGKNIQDYRSVLQEYGSDVGFVTVLPYYISEGGKRYKVPRNILFLLEGLYFSLDVDPLYQSSYRERFRLLKNDVVSFPRLGNKSFIASLFSPHGDFIHHEDLEYIILRETGVGFRMSYSDNFNVKMADRRFVNDKVCLSNIRNNYYNWKDR